MDLVALPIRGGCLCGAVRFELSEAPIASRYCWCRLCQYLGAGTGTVNVGFHSAALSVRGEMRDFVSIADSGSVMHRRFCPTCGTQLFSAAESRPHLVFVRGGTLDDTALAKPGGTIWTAAAPAWACIDDALPRIEGQPPPPSS